MDQERLQWMTKKNTLTSWEFKVEVSKTPSGPVATLWAGGRCNKRRGYLWTHTETLPVRHADYGLSDLVMHIEMVCEQEAPATQEVFERAMVGDHWEQPTLPF